MPLMSLVSENALRSRALETGRGGHNPKARDLVTYFVGQGVGLIDSVRTSGQVVQEFGEEEFLEAIVSSHERPARGLRVTPFRDYVAPASCPSNELTRRFGASHSTGRISM